MNFRRVANIVGRLVLSVAVVASSVVLLGGIGDFAIASMFPVLFAIWYRDRSMRRRVAAAACGLGAALLLQTGALFTVLGIASVPVITEVWSGHLVQIIGVALAIAVTVVACWLTLGILRSNPAFESGPPSAAAQRER